MCHAVTNFLSEPRVSVIIPNYQHEKYLENRIQSVLRQSFQDFEIILLDDASTDGSSSIIENYSDHPKVSQIHINEKNSGKPFLQWKRGLDLARGSLIWIAESDDDSRPEFLATMVKSFDTYSDLALATGMLEYIDEYGKFIGRVEEDLQGIYYGSDVLAKELGHRNCIRNTSSVVFDKHIGLTYIDQVTNYRYCGDWYFWSLIAMHPRVRMHLNVERLCLYRLHGNSVYGKKRGCWNNDLAIERFRVMSNINLNPAAAETATASVRNFILLNKDYRLWVYGAASNLKIFLKLFFRKFNWILLLNIANTMALDFVTKLCNRSNRMFKFIKVKCS